MIKDMRNDNSEVFQQSPLPKLSLPDIYRGKTVLVTGHTGFKGTWLAIWLKALGARVVGYSLEPNTKPSVFEETGFNQVAEVLAFLPTAQTATQVLEWGWDSSPAHREGLLSNDMTHACITGTSPFYVGILGKR